MDYNLSSEDNKKNKVGYIKAFSSIYKFLHGSKISILISFVFLLINSLTIIIAPFIIGDVTNKYLPVGDKDNLLRSLGLLAVIYLIGVIASYYQILVMGRVGQSVLFRVRNTLFQKLQSLPLKFFNQNNAGELISRINNDTDKLNQAFSETLLRFTGDIVVIIGIGIAMLLLNQTLGLIALIALVTMLVLTVGLLGWIKIKNENSLQKLGELSAEIQESLSNFRVTVVFNRRSYFRQTFDGVNDQNRKAATWAGIANAVLIPVYTYAGSIASMFILIFGIQILIFDKFAAGQMPEFGTLITFILYSNSFFGPLRELGELFAQMQTAIASWTRINRILRLNTDLVTIESDEVKHDDCLMKFENVSFGYDKENMVLNKINIELDAGKTYALVGPTGGGKSTAASLMARLYDVSEGQIFYKGKDIRSYEPEMLAKEIGFILQEPFLFSGTVAENLRYGNAELTEMSDSDLQSKLEELKLEKLLGRFKEGLQTEINPGGENISLGQKQLIAFLRALLRQPKLLILDEATANIDTVTEQLLEEILNSLSKETTRVIIAHRLNTIENADQIFFISGGTIEKPINFDSALNLINSSKRGS